MSFGGEHLFICLMGQCPLTASDSLCGTAEIIVCDIEIYYSRSECMELFCERLMGKKQDVVLEIL